MVSYANVLVAGIFFLTKPLNCTSVRGVLVIQNGQFPWNTTTASQVMGCAPLTEMHTWL